MLTLKESLRLVTQDDVIFAQAECGTKVAHVTRPCYQLRQVALSVNHWQLGNVAQRGVIVHCLFHTNTAKQADNTLVKI